MKKKSLKMFESKKSHSLRNGALNGLFICLLVNMFDCSVFVQVVYV